MARYDLFYTECRESVSSSYTTATTSGASTLNGYGTTFTLSSAPTPNFSQGQVVSLVDGAKTAYCTVTYVSGTAITLLPMRSASDSADVIGASFAGGSTITAGGFISQRAATLVVDLTDAPFTAATYLIVVSGVLTSDTSSSNALTSLRVSAQSLGDSLSGFGGYGASTTTFQAGNTNERVPFQAAISSSLNGGAIYEISLDFSTVTANATVTFDEARLVAIRCETITSAGDGKTAETTTTSTSLQTHLSLTTNLAAGTYLVASTWVAGISNLSYNCVVQLENSGTALSTSQFVPNATGDYLSGGFIGVVELSATNALALKYRTTNASGTAKIKNSFLAAVKLPPGFTAGYATTASDASATTTNNTDWSVLATLTPGTSLSAGRYLQMMSASTGGDTNRFRIRATTSGDRVTDDLAGFRAGTTSSNALASISLAREALTSGTTDNTFLIEGRSAVTGGSTFRVKTPRVSWLAERADIEPKHDTPVTVVADFELGGQIHKSWNSTLTTNRYSKRLPDYALISRVIVNGSLYTEASSTAAMGANTWFWDAATMDLYIQTSGEVPSANNVNVVVVPLALVGRGAYDLRTSSGTYRPYEARISSTPGVEEDLTSLSGRFESSRSIGSLDLAAADGAYDDLIVRHAMESYVVRLRRGWVSLSDRLDDFDIYATAITGMPSSDFETLRVKLFDRNILLSNPVASIRVAVYEGDTQRSDQLIPVVYGTVKRLVAYRTTNDVSSSSSYNTYKFADHAVKSVTAVYLDGSNTTPITAGNLQLTATYLNAGTIRVKNAAFSDATKPQDTVFVDLVGRTTVANDSTATAITTPGLILQDILLDFGGFVGGDLHLAAFSLLDRRWRSQLTANGFTRQAPLLGVVLKDEAVEEAIARVAGDAFAYVCSTPYGRISVRVPDLDAGNLLENPGMEMFATGVWPWTTASSATLALETSRKAEGQRALEIGNGSSAEANALQAVLLPRSGTYVLTLLASFKSGISDAFTLGITRPNGTTEYSEAFSVSSEAWSRATMSVTLNPGECGTAYVRIYPAKGSTTTTTVCIDNVELYEVAAIATQRNSNPIGVEFSDEHYYEAAVTYDVNLQEEQYASRAVVTDSTARLVGTATAEGQYAIASSKRADIGTTLYKDSSSASGVAAALANYFSRMRHLLSIDVMGLSRVPMVGEYLYVTDNSRVPELVNGNPIWRITSVSFQPDTAQTISLSAERQSDPVIDRTQIAVDGIPLGAILLSTSSIGTSITGYEEVTGLQDKFLVGARKPDVTSTMGSRFHTHTLNHTHAIASHTHSWSVSSVSTTLVAASAQNAYLSASAISYDAPGPLAIYQPSATFSAARGNASGHSHTVSPSGAATSAAATGTSSPSSSITTVQGSSDPSYVRVRFMQRTGTTDATISQNLIVGYESSTLPTGWERCDGAGGRPAMDGYYVRGWTANTAVSTTVATSSYVPASTGSTLKVTSASNISVGKRLTVTSGGNSMAVMVTAISGTDLTVTPLYETGNTIQTYAVGSAVAGVTEAPGTTVSVVAHDHSAAPPSHTHTGGGHTHGTTAKTILSATPVTSTVVVEQVNQAGRRVPGDHSHSFSPTLTASEETSSTATGTISAATPLPDTYQMVWMRPSSGNETKLPPGTLILWTQSSATPSGWEIVGQAVNKMLCGAGANTGSGSQTGGHAHSFTGAAHTFSHSHGGSQTVTSNDAYTTQTGVPMWNNSNTTVSAAAYADTDGLRLGHGHDVSITTTATSATMSATGTLTSTFDAVMPPYAKVLVLRKR